jgi:hypothetical protein
VLGGWFRRLGSGRGEWAGAQELWGWVWAEVWGESGGVRPWVRTWYEAWEGAGVSGLTPMIRVLGVDRGLGRSWSSWADAQEPGCWERTEAWGRSREWFWSQGLLRGE